MVGLLCGVGSSGCCGCEVGSSGHSLPLLVNLLFLVLEELLEACPPGLVVASASLRALTPLPLLLWVGM